MRNQNVPVLYDNFTYLLVNNKHNKQTQVNINLQTQIAQREYVGLRVTLSKREFSFDLKKREKKKGVGMKKKKSHI